MKNRNVNFEKTPVNLTNKHVKIIVWGVLNSQVSRWFCRTNDPLICRYPVLNVIVSEKCFKGLPLKFYFRPFGDIRSNRKWNLKSAVNRKRQSEIVFPVGIEGFKAWGMTWAGQIGLIMCYFLTIHTLGCREAAWNFGGQLFWNLTVNHILYDIYHIIWFIWVILMEHSLHIYNVATKKAVF